MIFDEGRKLKLFDHAGVNLFPFYRGLDAGQMSAGYSLSISAGWTMLRRSPQPLYSGPTPPAWPPHGLSRLGRRTKGAGVIVAVMAEASSIMTFRFLPLSIKLRHVVLYLVLPFEGCEFNLVLNLISSIGYCMSLFMSIPSGYSPSHMHDRSFPSPSMHLQITLSSMVRLLTSAKILSFGFKFYFPRAPFEMRGRHLYPQMIRQRGHERGNTQNRDSSAHDSHGLSQSVLSASRHNTDKGDESMQFRVRWV